MFPATAALFLAVVPSRLGLLIAIIYRVYVLCSFVEVQDKSPSTRELFSTCTTDAPVSASLLPHALFLPPEAAGSST